MLNQARYAQIDNYLDLYRFAGSLNDAAWQGEILNRLKGLQLGDAETEGSQEDQLQQQFIEVNRQILTLYQRLRCHTIQASVDVSIRLHALKERRLELGREIDALKHKDQQIFH
ncbi:hypothetical protein [Sporolactobacillus vineae]|uniref:hypothetical protein n=1 Tax=Sporolactobacillus vineae TaxID=444463 RepID=UPI0002886D0B|nr:hypothetical protein [Sporolactobacillus vineae]